MKKGLYLTGVLAVLLLTLFPPMIAIGSHGREWPSGHRFLFAAPHNSFIVENIPVTTDYRIDYKRFALLLGIVAIVTTGSAVAFRR